MADRLTVLIPTAGARSDLLRRTLDSIGRCLLPSNYAGVVVIENGPQRRVEQLVRDLARSDVRYLHVPEPSKARALNAALADQSGLLVFFDDDVRVHPYALRAYAEAAEGVNGGQYYGGPLIADWERAPPHWLVPFLPNSARGWLPAAPEATTTRFFLGPNWAAFASDLQRVGGFDPRFGPGPLVMGDETTMQRALAAAGVLPRYVPDAVAWHKVPATNVTPEWAVERTYKNGVAAGMSRALPLDPGARRRLDVVFRLQEAACRVGALLAPLPYYRFVARWRLSRTRGVRTGIALASRQGSRP